MAVSGYFDAVQKIYIAFYQRPADPAGLRYWAERLEAANGDATEIINAFATSLEARNLYGPIDADTIGNVIDGIYKALFGRPAEPAGKAFFEEAFATGMLTSGNIALAILNGAQGQDQMVIANKLVVANRFTETVDGRSLDNPEFGTGNDFAYDYTEEGKAVAAREALASVNADPESVLDNGGVKDVLDDEAPNPGDNENPGGGFPGAGNSAPTGKVSIVGEAIEGETLTVSHTLKDADGLGVISYQWLRDGEIIESATGSEYVLVQDDVDAVISVKLSYKDGKGKSESVTSAQTDSVANVDDEATGTLSISGTAEEGGSLVASLEDVVDADGSVVSTTYQWQMLVDDAWTDIVGATSDTLEIPGDQSYVGKDVRVLATTADERGGFTTFTGEAQTIVNVDDETTGTLSVSGTAEEGGSLVASLADAVDADGSIVSTAYQWQMLVDDAWTNISGADSDTLDIPDDQSYVGKDVRVVVTTTDALDGTTVFTGQTLTVANVNDVPVLANDIDDQSAIQGQAFSFALPAGAFSDADNETLTYSAALVDSDGELVGDGSLPAWLAFDPVTATFSGTPAHGDVGDIIIKVVATDAAGISASGVFTLEQIDQTAPANPTVALAAADDTGLAGDLVTNKAAVALQISGIEAGGRAWLDKNGNGVYDAGTDQLADGNGTINVANLVVGNNAYTIVSEDASGNTSSTTAVVVRDTAAPNRDVETPVSVDTEVDDGVYGEGDVITLMFGEAVKAETLLGVLPTLSSGHSFGDDAQIVATNTDSNGYATTFSITLGAGATVQATDTISFASTNVIDIAGNPAFDTVSFVLPALADTVQPVFSSPQTAAVNENQNQLYVAAATDGSALTYSLKAGQDAGLLSIDAATGVVTLASGSLDFESKTSYSFTVIATDASNNASEQSVTVSIDNLDEVAPAITSSDTATAIDENSGAGQVVYTVTATDTADISEGVVYSLKADTGDVAAFTIDEETGAVTLTGEPDFETKSSYSFTVVATDGAGLSSEKAVTLAINDIPQPVISLLLDSGVDEASGEETTTSSAISITFSLQPGATAEYSLDGGTTWLTGDEYDDATEADGNYSVTVRQINANGNPSENSSTLSFTKDTVGPAIASDDAIVSTPGAYVSGKTFTLSFSEAVSGAQLTIDDILVSNGHTLGSSATLTAINPDTYGFATSFTVTLGTGTSMVEGDTLTINADQLQDRAGNTATASVVFTVPDVTAPTFNAGASQPGNGITTDVGQDIVLQFSEALSDASDLTKVYLKNAATHEVVSATITIDGSTLVIDPAANLTLGENYYVTWGADVLKDAAGHAVAAVSDASTFSFSAGGTLAGTVQEINALTPAQLGAAASITVRDTAQAISDADFSAGNLAYIHADVARTITFSAADIQDERLAVVTVGDLAPVKVLIGPSTSAADVASAVAEALKALDGSDTLDSTTVTVSNDGQDGVLTLSSSLSLGKAAISVSYAEVDSYLPGVPAGTIYLEGDDVVVIALDPSELAKGGLIQLTDVLPVSLDAQAYAGITAEQIRSDIIAKLRDHDGNDQSADDKLDSSTVVARDNGGILEIVIFGAGLDQLSPSPDLNGAITFQEASPGLAVPDTQSGVSAPSTPVVEKIVLVDGETANAYLSVADVDGRSLALDSSGDQVTGEFVLRDSVAALDQVGAGLDEVTGIDSFEVSDTVAHLFNGDSLSAALSSVLGHYTIDKVTVTGGNISLAQAQALQTAATNEAGSGIDAGLVYNLADSAANLLAANDAQRELIGAAGDADVTDVNVGLLTYAQLADLYSLIDEDAGQPHDQQLTYSLLAGIDQLFDGSALNQVASSDYLPNASSLTVVGATVKAATVVDGDTGTAEVQAIVVVPEEGGEYRLTVGGVTLRTDVLEGSTTAELVAQLQQSAGYAAAGFTVSAGEGLHAGSILVSWKSNGDQTTVAELTSVDSLTLGQAQILADLRDLQGDDLTSVTYDLKLTAAELVAIWDGEDAEAKALLSGARDITVTDDMTVDQAGRLANIGNGGTAIFNIVDTSGNLASGAGVIERARDLQATTTASASQAQAIYDDRGDSGTLTFSVTDSIGNLINDAYKNAMNAAVDISTSSWINATQAQKVVDFDNTGYVRFYGIMEDGVSALNAFIDTNGAGSEEGNTLRPYTYRVWDNAANITAAAIDGIDPDNAAKDSEDETTQHVLLNAALIQVSGSMSYEQATTLVNTLELAQPSLLADDLVSYSVRDSVANLGNDRIWLDGDAEPTDVTRAIKHADGLYINDTAAHIAEAQNANSAIDSGDLEVFLRINQAHYGSITATGSDGSQTIAGSIWGDVLDGGEGYDILYGNGGNDTLHGGNGNDVLYGGDGRDTIYAGTAAGIGTGNSYTGVSDQIYGGNGGDNMFGSGTSGYYDRDQFVYLGNTRDALRAESGTTTTSRDYINNMGYGDSIKFANVQNENVFFLGTASVAANPVTAGTLAISLSYDRNIKVANWDDTGLVDATKVNVDIADATGRFDGIADMHIIVIGSNMDLNWNGEALAYGA